MNSKKVAKSLNELRDKVSVVGKAYPKSGTAGGAGVARAQEQIPWICRTLDEASGALITKRDPFGNPIRPDQVASGLKQLVAYVRDPSYGTLMEMVYRGIDQPLQECMDELEEIISEIK